MHRSLDLEPLKRHAPLVSNGWCITIAGCTGLHSYIGRPCLTAAWVNSTHGHAKFGWGTHNNVDWFVGVKGLLHPSPGVTPGSLILLDFCQLGQSVFEVFEFDEHVTVIRIKVIITAKKVFKSKGIRGVIVGTPINLHEALLFAALGQNARFELFSVVNPALSGQDKGRGPINFGLQLDFLPLQTGQLGRLRKMFFCAVRRVDARHSATVFGPELRWIRHLAFPEWLCAW